VSDDLVELVAAYRGITVKEAKKLDAMEELPAIFRESGVLSFFIKLLMPFSEQKSVASLLSFLGK
jgi:hypothetical protein